MICVNETIYLYKTNEDSLMNNKNNSMEINSRITIYTRNVQANI